MPSEYEIYRAYAGLNRPQSKLDYFLQGVGKLQSIAESNKRLELQERRLDQEDERANEQLELARTREERMREQYEYNKQKNIEDRKFSKQTQAWNSISSFAGQLPEGQRYNFMMKQSGNIMDDDFMQSQGIYDKMEAFKEAEEDGIAMGDMYFNMRNEDSADKIEQFLNMDVITDNSKKQVLQNRVNSIRKKEKEWEPFDIDLLSAKKQRDYKSIVESYNKKSKDLMEAQLARGADKEPNKQERQLAGQVEGFNRLIKDYEKQAATAPLPVFTASTESLQAVADDDDLMTAFFGDESNNLDEFIEARNVNVKPAIEEVDEGVKEETKEADSTSSAFIEKYGINPFPKLSARDDITRQATKSNITSKIGDIKQDIDSLERQISAIDRVMRAPVKSGSKKSEIAKKQKENLNVKLAELNQELVNAQNQFDSIDTAVDFASK